MSRPELERSLDVEIVRYGIDAEADPATFDVESFIEAAVRDLSKAGVSGVVSSSDYPGCLVAAVIARRLGLPGPDPVSLLRASHKYYSRLKQALVVPDAVPRFTLLDPELLLESQLTFPIFVKPVKSWFSQHARRIESFAELVEFASSPSLHHHLTEFVKPFNALLREYPEFRFDGSHLIAEEVLHGVQVTLEGFVIGGRAATIGVVDSTMYDGTTSFEWFTVPTRLDTETVDRMSVIAQHVLASLEYTDGLFNIEFMYDAKSKSIHVIEVNPRMCGQFADLFQSVLGINTYEILFSLGLGLLQLPDRQRTTNDAVAGSRAVRMFSDGVVRSLPSARRARVLMRLNSVTLFIVYCHTGELLSERPKQFDGQSYRYAVVNCRARDFRSLERRVSKFLRLSGIRVEAR